VGEQVAEELVFCCFALSGRSLFAPSLTPSLTDMVVETGKDTGSLAVQMELGQLEVANILSEIVNRILDLLEVVDIVYWNAGFL
jgi:hypothetical protein